ncbi:MAG: 1-(5-phosphoribosyl)-5-[(5-phosphoribosylamino)methylideneamino]imidazole-4-carboxamide isomerase [Gammaproteobacteria bacterium]|nr:1-(5-phosphoribosyl)-5-[(5-phosphoribosylamino)methylideneamino]imidazole-4-carboxamide isomerase [Gammaproteobacteria bacterium]
MRVLPAIDIRDGKSVRLFQGDFDQQTTYPIDPAVLAQDYARAGFRELHLVDLDGAKDGHRRNLQTIDKIVAAGDVQIQLGGGIRRESDLRELFSAGVTRCVVGSVAAADPRLVSSWLEEFGTGAIVLALDVRVQNDEPWVQTHGWTRSAGITLWQLLDAYADCGVVQVLCTDVACDGALAGPNAQLYRDTLDRYPAIELQASGGIRDIEDLQTLRGCGASAAITGRALLDGRISNSEIEQFLRVA